ncbi:Nudix family hydrolase [Propionivibrio dicarboxylicus]|uniref:8-oxo-dGTP diphosphatase n=1 Tax=Propionivibrio dicarboxylicus TaxID=83767 RepID=A0A1G7UZ62_9RHOO|nr:Nudix family hydrolase [Propionivibrio dicarboxylicus]SDG52777.1 8-oxo-dGTP diphosphatase [Propionivibrio dicarboxylicus]
MTGITEVAAAVLLRDGDAGREYLLAQRPPGKAYAGYWEFPGGKVEAGETTAEALVRELDEELGIRVLQANPWITREFVYPHAHVRLKFFHVHAWEGELHPHEHTGMIWTRIGETPTVSPVLPANGPILRALELPRVCALTNAGENGIAAELARLEEALHHGLRLIQLRDKGLAAEARRDFSHRAMTLARQHPGTLVLVNDDDALAREIGADGLHLTAQRLMRTGTRPDADRVAASCHNAEELAQAAALGLDFVLLGPVLPTRTHPDHPGLGWENFARLSERLPLPVFALGGMSAELQDYAQTQGAHGVAMLRDWR